MGSAEQMGSVIETDVLIVGGGLAGLNAAIAAAEHGVSVVIMDKGGIARSGAMGGGIDHFTAYLETGEEWDTREAYLQNLGKVARGAVDLKVHNAIYCRELKGSIERLARIGNPLTQPDGTFYRTRSMGRDGPLSINFNGKKLKPRLADEVRRLGVRALEKVMTTSLLTRDGQVIGAMGFSIRTGDLHVVHAKATVLSTGRVDRLFETPTGIPFNTWQCPSDTGGAQAMAFRAGAALANMEYVLVSVVPKGFSAAGLNGLTGMGARLVNALGEEYMIRYHPHGSRAPRFKLAEGALTEIREGRGPIYVDCRHLSPAELEHLNMTLGYDKDTLPDFVRQKGIDLAKDPLELQVSEGAIGGPTGGLGSGIMIDERSAATVPGLFAGGDCTDQAGTCAPSVTSGYAAGKQAAKYASTVSSKKEIDWEQAAAERARVLAPMETKPGVHYREIEDVVQKIMWQGVGPARNELGLKKAIEKLDSVEPHLGDIGARDYHELMRANETRDLVLIGKIMASCALYRKESRFGAAHFRVDYPKTDDENWLGLVAARRNGEQIETSLKRLSYEMPEP